jgi:hypothetical protein
MIPLKLRDSSLLMSPGKPKRACSIQIEQEQAFIVMVIPAEKNDALPPSGKTYCIIALLQEFTIGLKYAQLCVNA